MQEMCNNLCENILVCLPRKRTYAKNAQVQVEGNRTVTQQRIIDS